MKPSRDNINCIVIGPEFQGTLENADPTSYAIVHTVPEGFECLANGYANNEFREALVKAITTVHIDVIIITNAGISNKDCSICDMSIQRLCFWWDGVDYVNCIIDQYALTKKIIITRSSAPSVNDALEQILNIEDRYTDLSELLPNAILQFSKQESSTTVICPAVLNTWSEIKPKGANQLILDIKFKPGENETKKQAILQVRYDRDVSTIIQDLQFSNSTNPNIGTYRYISAGSRVKEIIVIPPGVSSVSFCVKKWGQNSKLSLQSIICELDLDPHIINPVVSRVASWMQGTGEETPTIHQIIQRAQNCLKGVGDKAVSQALTKLALIKFDMGATDDADKLVESAISIHPTWPAHMARLNILERRRNKGEIALALERANSYLIKNNGFKSDVLSSQLFHSRWFPLMLCQKLAAMNKLEGEWGRRNSNINKVCYVQYFSLPFSTNGYATRGHGLATGMKNAGLDVTVITRPGFPWDIGSADNNTPHVNSIDDVIYRRIPEPRKDRSQSNVHYALEAIDAFTKIFEQERPAVVIASSNHLIAIPALLAARHLGIPFVYEVRGFWEITKISKMPNYAEDISFEVESQLEAEVSAHADRILTLTEPMKERLIEFGISTNNIFLVPNSCNVTRFVSRERDESLAKNLGITPNTPVIGYIGSFVDYEGLDDLVQACIILRRAGYSFRVILVGNDGNGTNERGPIASTLHNMIYSSQMEDWIKMPGRIPHDQVEGYYSLIDIAPFPRKPLPVCEMVSPLKPLEALAMSKAVIVSSVRALEEMIIHNDTGIIFQKGSVQGLVDALAALISDSALRKRLGDNGRKWVETERTWDIMGARIKEIIVPLLSPEVAKVSLSNNSH